MSEQLFRDVAKPSVRVGQQTWKTIPLSIGAHALILGGLVVVPLMATGALPSPSSVMMYVAPPFVPPPPDLPRATPPPPVSTPQPAVVPNYAAAPTQEPPRIGPEPQGQRMPSLSDVFTGPSTLFVGVPSSTRVMPALPLPPAVTKPLPIGGNIKEPSKIHHVRPVYPAIAQNAKISGIVIIEATIGRDGTVIETKVLRSVPLLDQAALDAVKQWRFTPTLLNGMPVPIVMTVTVNFTLN